jgi:uncharacterized protein (DUF488 family)
MHIFTIGYEGSTIDSFFAQLIGNDIQTLVDIREIPTSRKPGFSGKSLKAEAEKYSIEYIHYQKLGCPQEIRHDYKKDGNWERYSKRFLGYLRSQSDELIKLAELASKKPCCLLCFESDYNRCHRSYVAKRLSVVSDEVFTIHHLDSRAVEKVAWLKPLGDKPNLQLAIDLETDVLYP